MSETSTLLPDNQGKFGDFGGRYVPETLMAVLIDLEREYLALKQDASFKAEFAEILKSYVGRPTALYRADRLAAELGNPNVKIYLKREDLCHTGAHKINNSIGQALLAKRLGKKKIIAETGAGQHGVATATACAMLGLECEVFMGAEDMERQNLNVFRMRLLGATVTKVTSGTATLKDATNEAMRQWMARCEDTHYIVGSVVGPHPFPMIVRDFQSIIGIETRQQIMELEGSLPDALVACVGGGSNSIGLFYPFYDDSDVKMYGVEAGGCGVDTNEHAATITKGSVGVFHGSKIMLLQTEDGQIQPAHSISAGLDYPGVGPEHSFYYESKRATYEAVTDAEALEGVKLLCRTEGIIPALESAHAIAFLQKLVPQMESGVVVMCLSGRGDKDVFSIAKGLGQEL